MNRTYTCNICGRELTFAQVRWYENGHLCNACGKVIDKRELLALEVGAKISMYLDVEKKRLTRNGLKIRVPHVFEGDHNWWNCNQYYAYFELEGQYYMARSVQSYTRWGGYARVQRLKHKPNRRYYFKYQEMHGQMEFDL